MKTNAVVFGAGGHAKVVADILRLRGHQVAGFIDEVSPQRRGDIFFGSPILGGREDLLALRAQGVRHVIVAFGDNARRIAAGDFIEASGFELITAIHPSAILGGEVHIGAGSMLAAGAVVNAGSIIGKHCIVNTCASVDHDCVLAEGVSIGPGGRLAGKVRVGCAAFIGMGASIIERRQICAGAVVGAGAVVTKDVLDTVVVVGVPARVLKRVQSA